MYVFVPVWLRSIQWALTKIYIAIDFSNAMMNIPIWTWVYFVCYRPKNPNWLPKTTKLIHPTSANLPPGNSLSHTFAKGLNWFIKQPDLHVNKNLSRHRLTSSPIQDFKATLWSPNPGCQDLQRTNDGLLLYPPCWQDPFITFSPSNHPIDWSSHKGDIFNFLLNLFK